MKNKWLIIVLIVVAVTVLFSVFTISVMKSVFSDTEEAIHGEGVGLVEVKGIILDPQETVKQLQALRKNEKVKAVVLRIDSPGGVVGPSQEIHDAVKKLNMKKKVVVSMGSLAASGGYYIAVPATKIFANPGTITGSIGVLMKFSNIEGLMDKVGMKAFTLKTGKFKDVGSPARTMTDQEKEMLQSVIDSTHGQFIKAVAEGRKLPVEEVRSLANGRIYSGEQALALKLIDQLGTLQDAVEEAGRLGGIKGEPEIIRPPKKKKVFIDLLVESAAERISSFAVQEKGLTVNYEMNGNYGY
ncbi:peptidase, S49 family [Geotalea daltonii FRC-32]|uniref:Peptidase, S49 family n=1 Tax=Geotalea daltonii (strain DSM 22248 / JCM 15807 / FRC-32) TaxID=316067 RepID=B9M2Q3_GEODF|nr:signal peptide peptidase SppA [Geotalea daltonii]ACM21249.1 peptidase, S49 family [Geotalea daltonii FRC-32]